MSILLSAYFPEGIVFAADRNVTVYDLGSGFQNVEVGAVSKVIPWPYRKAVVGYCGLAELASLRMDEWMRQFVAQTRELDDLAQLAKQMHRLIQRDFDRDYPEGANVEECALIVHLGGFQYEDGVAFPAMYYISNVPGYDQRGKYYPAVREFTEPEDHLHREAAKSGVRSPSDYKPWLEQIHQAGQLMWFNNGLGFPAFNIIKGTLWAALNEIRRRQFMPLRTTPSVEDRIAYCSMAVESYGSFFFHHYQPRYRSVGGGVDAEYVPWPK
jgi:hypothetical protein